MKTYLFVCAAGCMLSGCVYYPARFTLPECSGSVVGVSRVRQGNREKKYASPVPHALLFIEVHKSLRKNYWLTGPGAEPLKYYRYYTFSDHAGRFHIPRITRWYTKMDSLFGRSIGISRPRCFVVTDSTKPYVVFDEQVELGKRSKPGLTWEGFKRDPLGKRLLDLANTYDFHSCTWSELTEFQIRNWFMQEATALSSGDASEFRELQQKLKAYLDRSAPSAHH